MNSFERALHSETKKFIQKLSKKYNISQKEIDI